MKILVAAVGSHGDVLPFIGLCREFQARGQEVYLYASAYFAVHAEEVGVPLRPLGDAAEHIELLRDPDLAHLIRGHRVIGAALERWLPNLYEALSADVDPGRTLVIGSLLAFPARLLRETRGVPCVIVHLSPTTLRSNVDTPRMTPLHLESHLPRGLKSFLWRAVDRWLLDPLYGAPLNRYRQTLGLPPVRGVFDRWLNQADLILAMFPDWFAAPQPDWSPRLQQTGFPLYDPEQGAAARKRRPLAPALQAFLEAGEPPVGFTAGTATASAGEFFAASVEACRRSGRRGLLLAHRPEQIPVPLPREVAHFPYVPFVAVLPRLAALVHHGGIGTVSHALQAGIPQLIRPMAYDQLDNSRRAQALGVALELPPRRYNGRTAARALDALLADPRRREHCRHWAARLEHSAALGRSCDLILDTFAHRARTRP